MVYGSADAAASSEETSEDAAVEEEEAAAEEDAAEEAVEEELALEHAVQNIATARTELSTAAKRDLGIMLNNLPFYVIC